jgi:hypothetical protein
MCSVKSAYLLGTYNWELVFEQEKSLSTRCEAGSAAAVGFDDPQNLSVNRRYSPAIAKVMLEAGLTLQRRVVAR